VTGVALTAEQQRAAERREDGLLVAAGAGSGKTSVLVERFTRAVVADGVAIGAILAITFTEKAAAELKGRVRDRLIAEGRHVEARAAEGAFISTIHGFCSRLLRTHALAAGIDPEYRVLDALEAERLGVEAFDGALSAFLHADADPERLRLVAAYTPDRLAAMVRTAYAHLRSRGAIMPELPEIEPPRPGDQRERLERAAGAALGEIAALDGVVVGRARARIERCVELLERSPDVAELDAAALGKLGVGTGANALKTPAFDAYREALDALTALVSHQQEYRDQGLLRDLLHSYGDRYATLKRDRSALDFDDLELQANELLRTDPLVRERWAERFEHVMIDEFEDTSPLQNELLERIAGERLFRVGDEFQSIYRFRHADVAVFREQADRARAQDRFESLTANFRSRPEVLDAINVLFGAVWGERFPRLRAGSPGGVQAPDRPSVELIVADRPHNGSRWRERFAAAEGGPELAFGETLRDVTPARAAEARILAKRIDELLGEGRCTAGDVVLLVRATTHLAAYERALEDRGIPTYVMGGRGYWSQQQVGDLRAYLAALANPLDELALYTALASPLAGVSVDGLIVLRAAARTSRRDPWTVLRDLVAGGAQAQTVATELGTADAERARRFAALLGEERDRAPRLSIETVIDRAVTRSGYDLHVLAASAGRRRMANVRKLMRLAREFEAEEGRDLRAFIDYVAATRAEELLILSGATDLEKLPEEQPLEEPLRWIWRALAPELPEIESEATVERSIDGRAVPIRCLVLRPDTVDELLTPADRAPRRADAPPPGLEALDVPALAAVPPPRALAVSRLSYTGLQRYAECGYRFYLERSLRLPRPDALAPVDVVAPEPLDALPAIVRGAVAHQLLERLDHMSPAAPAPEAVARAIAAHGEVVRDDEVAEIARLVAGFAGTPIQRRIAAAERVRAELAFAFTLAPPGGGRHPLLVNGVVDVHATEPDRVLIVDYKSDRLGDRDPDELVSGDYATQRLVYALAALRSGAERVEVAYVLLERPDDPVTAVYERSDVPPLEDRLRELAAGVTEGRFAPTDRPWRGLCGDCPGQPGLCSWEPERTLAPEPA
jgi:ATP-dependent exoDNAse (exonuclease V) beta subunit